MLSTRVTQGHRLKLWIAFRLKRKEEGLEQSGYRFPMATYRRRKIEHFQKRQPIASYTPEVIFWNTPSTTRSHLDK
jgi:hypothetical protein